MSKSPDDAVIGETSPPADSRIYRIRVEGRLGHEWSDLAGGMKLVVHSGDDGQTMSDLLGLVIDEAHLKGILDLLYTHRARLVRVERLDHGEDITSTVRDSRGEGDSRNRRE